MSASGWTHLVIFNSKLKHDAQSSLIDPTLDKEDWDEAAQILFAQGSGWINGEGKKEWNAILKQMGLAKGLMGFMSTIESQSFPESEEDKDVFQIIHSKRRVTCIYQIEADYCLVAVYTLATPTPPSSTPNEPSGRPKHEPAPPKQAVATDEQYKTALTQACGHYLLKNGSLSSRMESKGQADVNASLETFWSSWVKNNSRIPQQAQLVDTSQTEVDQSTLKIWSELLQRSNGQEGKKECILLSHEGILITSGSVLLEPSLVQHLEQTLQTLSPKTRKEVKQSGESQSSSRKDGHGHEDGTWKKLGLGSWGSAVGFGSSDKQSNVESTKQETGNKSAIKGNLGESAPSSGASWGGIGHWFGIGSPSSGAVTPGTASPSVRGSSPHVDGNRDKTNRAEVDLASLNSALDSDLGGLQEQGETSSIEQAIGWTKEELWSKSGTVPITVFYAIGHDRLFAWAIRGHDADASTSPAINSGLLQALFSSHVGQHKEIQPTTQFNDRHDPKLTEAVKYLNPLQLEIRETSKAGRGVFASSDMPAGTILEESPILVLTRAEWDEGRLDDGVLGGYAFNWSNGGMAIGLGIACMFNHSPKPNVNFIRRAPNSKSPDVEPAIVFMTSQRIQKGEELYICYGQESKLWFSPDYGNTISHSDNAAQEDDVDDADVFLSGFDGLVDPVERQDEAVIGDSNDHAEKPREAEAEPPTKDHPLGKLAVLPQVAIEEVENEMPVTDPIIANNIAEVEDENRRNRKREKKALQDEKASKYHQKKAARAAATKQVATDSVKLAPALKALPRIDHAATNNSDYQAALNKLGLVGGIDVSSDDIIAIETEESGQTDFEGAHGFAGWRRVKRVPGLLLSGEAPLDSTRGFCQETEWPCGADLDFTPVQVWAVEVPPQMIGKLTQYIRHRKLVEDELAHLKRIYKNLSTGMTLIALYTTSKMSREDVRNDLEDYDTALSEVQILERVVPARAAHSMKEVEILKPLWPVALRQRAVLAADLPWSATRKAWVKNGIKEVVKLAKEQKATGEHCVAVFATSAPKAAQLHDPDAIPPTPDIRAVGFDTRREAGHPLRHATISCVTEIANLRTMSPFADVLATRNGAGYLLTSLSVFMTHEPCVMCAMALVHSRVKEVFYLTGTGGSSKGGGFGGSYPVHSHPGLNHQMDLFDCSELVSEDDLKEIMIADTIDI